MPDCKHMDFSANVTVNRLADTGRFSADVRIECAQCHHPFQFLGLPMGLDLNGAAMSVDGKEAGLAIAPVGTIPESLAFVPGFRVKGPWDL